MTLGSARQMWCGLFCLAGASVAVFVTGKEDVLAMSVAAMGGGGGMLIGKPSARPGVLPILFSALFLMASLAALLPAAASMPSWRSGAPDILQLADSYAAVPPYLAFWWLSVAVTVVVGWFLASSPLETGQLRIFLHAVTGIIAAYAVVSIVQAHTPWTYPLSGGANFGLLPNRNHTATLLVVGSVISFGTMQWEVARGHRFSAAISALCGAPSLAALLFFSTSRAGVLFLLLGLMLWTVGATGQAVQRRTTLAAAAVLAVFLSVLFVFGGSTVRDRIGALWQDTMAMDAEDGEVRAIDFRQPVFSDTLKMVQDAPLTGHGLGHFEFVFPHYRVESLSSARVLHPESDWLMVAAESGVPALVVLLTLAGWYFRRCWSARTQSGGLLRWTVASAIGAALAHGVIDVPWHRPALGWFLFVVALVSLPSGLRALQWPGLWRGAQVVWGVLLVAIAGYLVWARSTDRPPLAYRWVGYANEMKALLASEKYDDGEFVAREALRDFPLDHQSYYWRAAFLRMFEATDQEMAADLAAGRYVEPALPSVAAQQAQLWESINDGNEAAARIEAVKRAALIDARTGTANTAAAELEKGLRAATERPNVQVELRKQLAGDPALLAHWARLALPELADEYLASLGDGVGAWLDGLPPDLRGQVLSRWITLPSAAIAAAYMEARNAPAPGAYWRQLAEYYAKAGDKARAVGMVAEAEGLPLDGPLTSGEFGGQLAALEAQGNIVSVRRLLKEAAEGGAADPDKLRVAVSWCAAAGDWEMAWKAASRLASARKNGQ